MKRSRKQRRLRRKILDDPEAKRVLLKVMTHGGKETVEVDGTTYTVENIPIFNRPMDRILEEKGEQVQKDDSESPLSSLWRAGKKLFMAFWWAG